MADGRYSVLWFNPEITEMTSTTIKNFLMKGLKVYFFTFDDIEGLLEDTSLKECSEKGLLILSEVRYSENWDGKSYFFFDGKDVDMVLLDYLENNCSFNKEQYVLEHSDEEQHFIVKAGAGTGKTTTMVNRILYLIHMKPDLNMGSVVMITFTNEAAIHMRKKLMEKLKGYYDITKNQKYLEWMGEVGNMFIGTIHSFAKEFLSIEGQRLGFSQSMQVRSYLHDRKKLIEKYIDRFAAEYAEAYQSFRYLPHYKLIRAFMNFFERINNKSISYEAIQSMEYGHDQKGFNHFASYVIGNVTTELTKKKLDEEALEINDLISQLGIMKSIDKNQLKLTIRYLFVDEFQDTDEAQVSFVVWLTENYQCQLFAVGDIKQSIYRFRGADYTAFIQLKEHLKNGNQSYHEYSIRKNYRSEHLLINQFNQLFQKWDNMIDKFHYDESDRLLSVKEDTAHEGIVTLKLDDNNLIHVLKRLYKQNIAVLVRSNRQVLDMVEKIESLGFFCDAEVTGSFYRSLPVREFYLLLRRFTHPKVAKDRYLFHQSSYGPNEISIAKILQAFTSEKPFVLDLIDLYENWDNYDRNFQYQSTISVLQTIIEHTKPYDVFRRRYYQMLKEQFPDQDREMQKKEAMTKMKEYKVNLDRLIFLLKKEFGDFQASVYDLEKFLSIKMATDSTENEWKQQSDVSHRVKVMTVHKAKGLEFDYILMPLTTSAFIKDGKTDILLLSDENSWKVGYYINWKDQIIENDIYKEEYKAEQEEMIAEEARLLYVALTRAKKGIIVDSSPTMNRYTIQYWSDLLESGERLSV
jgi:DNA helicase II / ATP-dependent DNA helicase PcrA